MMCKIPKSSNNPLSPARIFIYIFFSSGATAPQGLCRQSGRRRSAKLVPTFADRGVSRGHRNGSPRPLISVYRTWIATYFIQVAPQLTSLLLQMTFINVRLPLLCSPTLSNSLTDVRCLMLKNYKQKAFPAVCCVSLKREL